VKTAKHILELGDAMRSHRLLLAALIVVSVTPLARAQKLERGQIEQSIRYINGLQGTDGGFRPAMTEAESDVSATTVALRALKYMHSQARPRNSEAAKAFVLKCYQPSTGSFVTKLGREPDVRSTAMGLMAMAELKMPVQGYAELINRYFADHAKSLPDIYIAAASLDAAGLTTPKTAEWIAAYEATRNADGSYSNDATQHAGAVITILRLGGSIKDRDAAASTLRESQRDDGGFSAKPGDPSDLSSTYRIMRALYMLRQKPQVDRLRAFIARCRNDDGGYGVKPSEPSSASATYFAAIVLHWLDEMERN
jgi:prenyltransferase beta subunit